MTGFAVASFTRDVSRGVAQLLAAEITNGPVWSDTAEYDPAAWSLWTDVMPPDPDRVTLVSSNQASADPSRASSLMLVQFRSRATVAGGADEASGMDDLIGDVLLSRRTLLLPNGVQVWSIDWSHGGSLGPDDAHGRAEWASNYRLGVYRPGSHRK